MMRMRIHSMDRSIRTSANTKHFIQILHCFPDDNNQDCALVNANKESGWRVLFTPGRC